MPSDLPEPQTCAETRDTGRQGMPSGTWNHQAFFLGLRFSLFFGLLSPMIASSLAMRAWRTANSREALVRLSTPQLYV